MEQAFIAGAVNLVFLFSSSALGGLGVWWNRKLFLRILIKHLAVRWGSCSLDRILAASDSGAAQPGDAIDYYYGNSATALPTVSVSATVSASISAKPTLAANTSASASPSVSPSASASQTTTVAVAVTTTDQSAVANGKKKRQDVVPTSTSLLTASAATSVATTATANVTASVEPSVSASVSVSASPIPTTPSPKTQPMLLFLEAIVYGIQILLLLFASILSPFIQFDSGYSSNDYSKSGPNGGFNTYDSRGTVYVEKGNRHDDDEDDDEADSRRYDTAIGTNNNNNKFSNSNDRYNQGTGGRYTDPKPAADLGPARPVRGTTPVKRGDTIQRNNTVTKVAEPEGRIGPSSPSSPSGLPRGANNASPSVSVPPTSVSRTPTGSKKYVAGPHNVEAVPTLSRRDVYSVYTTGSANSRDNTSKESTPVFAPVAAAATTKPGQVGLTRTVGGKEPKVRCKSCDEKMPMSETAAHVCATGPKSASLAAARPVAAGPLPRKPRTASDQKAEKLDGKRVKVVKRFAPTMADELALEVGVVVHVKESFGDGWANGKNETSDDTGVFPLSCVSKTAKSAQNRVQSVYGFKR
ncbi:UNVERIFIED_CONTAM: hypothetical protein HDU68_003910 [Siphonaria sp. JEL0065]|nr:hypothetical protein HDU68_003910 [Siphonaria sp. JEL0065]